MVDLTFTPQIEILSVEDAPRRRHWNDGDKVRVVEESQLGHRQVELLPVSRTRRQDRDQGTGEWI